MRLLHRESDCISRFSIPITTFWCKDCVGATTVQWPRRLRKLKNSHFHSFPRCNKRPVRLLHRESDCILRFSIHIPTFWCKHCLGVNTIKMSSTYSKILKFPFPELYWVNDMGFFVGPKLPVRLLHRESDWIFRFSIPIATFWCKHCLGVNTVPLSSTASKIQKFPFS